MAEVIEHVTMTDRGIRGLASRALRPFHPGDHSAVDDAAIATFFDGDGARDRPLATRQERRPDSVGDHVGVVWLGCVDFDKLPTQIQRLD
jgi:hypothetical protein